MELTELWGNNDKAKLSIIDRWFDHPSYIKALSCKYFSK